MRKLFVFCNVSSFFLTVKYYTNASGNVLAVMLRIGRSRGQISVWNPPTLQPTEHKLFEAENEISH
jgi:hypothetical protein